MHKRLWVTLTAAAVFMAGTGCGNRGETAPHSGVASLAKSPSELAAMEIAGARELEKLRKAKKAIEAYERIAKEFPDSPQSKVALERINALKGSKSKLGSKR